MGGMIEITSGLALHEDEIQEAFIHSSGPGGQHVNKVATAVQLRFNVAQSPALPEPVRQRLRKLGGKRITEEGVLVITARRYRTQARNRKDARERLVALIRKAAQPPQRRRKTKPTRASKEARLKAKRRRGAIKRMRRGGVPGDDD